jgi:hypothetical protein
VKEKILQLLGSGLAPVVVANAVGCDASYVSQLLGQEEFALEVARLRCQGVEKDLNRDNKYDTLEDKLLEKLENVLPFMMKPREILEALKVVNTAKRRAHVGQQTESGKTIHVHLQLPPSALAHFSLNHNNEVIEVAGRVLTNMPAAILMKSLEAKNEAANERERAPALKLSTKQVERAIVTPNDV